MFTDETAFPSFKSLLNDSKDTGTQVNNSITFIFIADKVFRFHVARTFTTICPCLDTVVNDC